MPPTREQLAMGEGIDHLVNAEISGRGVIGGLYAAARRTQDGPLCPEAASRLLETVRKGDVVVLATGWPTPPWFAGEQDGPVGAATLARALVLGIGARPVIVTDPANVDICAAAIRGAGLYVRSIDDALRLPTTTAVVPFPLEWDEAEVRTQRLLRLVERTDVTDLKHHQQLAMHLRLEKGQLRHAHDRRKRRDLIGCLVHEITPEAQRLERTLE